MEQIVPRRPSVEGEMVPVYEMEIFVLPEAFLVDCGYNQIPVRHYNVRIDSPIGGKTIGIVQKACKLPALVIDLPLGLMGKKAFQYPAVAADAMIEFQPRRFIELLKGRGKNFQRDSQALMDGAECPVYRNPSLKHLGP